MPINAPEAITIRQLLLRADTADERSRTIGAVLSTENPVPVLDARSFEVIDEVLVTRGAMLPPQLPLLDAHDRSTADTIRGSVRAIRAERVRTVGVLHLADDEPAIAAWRKIVAGHLTDVSVGYAVHRSTDIPASESREVEGKRYTAGARTLRVVTSWTPREVSLVPIGADEGAKIGARRTPFRGRTTNMRTTTVDRDRRALAAGLMHRAGLAVIDEHAPADVRTEQERDAERGDRYAGHSLGEICRECLRIEDRPDPGNTLDRFRNAVATATMSDVFTTLVGSAVTDAYEAAPDSTRGWCVEMDLPNYKLVDRVSTSKAGALSRLPRGGEAETAEWGASAEQYRLARYASQFVLDDQDIEDDNVGALVTMAQELGEAAAELRPDLVYSILLANDALDVDGVALFHADHGNLGTSSSALSATSLESGISAMQLQQQAGRNLNLPARFLIVPANLRLTARQLLRDADIEVDGEQLMLRSDARLSANGVTDPVTGTAYAGDGAQWFLATGPRRTIEVGYLAGSGRRPSIREFVLPPGQWGIGWDVVMDIGAKALDYRGLYKATGAA